VGGSEARAEWSQERELCKLGAGGRKGQSGVRYEGSNVVEGNSRVFGQLDGLKGVFEKLRWSLKTGRRLGA
jgi:hypothetical protein